MFSRFFTQQLFQQQQRHFQQQHKQLPTTLTRGFSNYIEPLLKKDNHVYKPTTTQNSESHLLTCYGDLYSNYHHLDHSYSQIQSQLYTQQKLTTLYGMATLGLVGVVLYQCEHINKYHEQNETECAHFQHFMDDLNKAINTTHHTLAPTYTDPSMYRRYQLESQREALNKMLIDLTTKFDKSFANRQTFELFTTVLKNTIKLCDEGIGALKFQENLYHSLHGNNNNIISSSSITTSSTPSTTATSMLAAQHPDYFYNLMRLYNQQQYPEHYNTLSQTSSSPSLQFQQFHQNQHPSLSQSPPHASHHQQSQQQTTNIA
eukprot:UN00355